MKPFSATLSTTANKSFISDDSKNYFQLVCRQHLCHQAYWYLKSLLTLGPSKRAVNLSAESTAKTKFRNDFLVLTTAGYDVIAEFNIIMIRPPRPLPPSISKYENRTLMKDIPWLHSVSEIHFCDLNFDCSTFSSTIFFNLERFVNIAWITDFNITWFRFIPTCVHNILKK